MKPYTVTIRKCKYWFHILNHILFDDQLVLNFEFKIKDYTYSNALAVCYSDTYTRVFDVRMNSEYENKIIFLNSLAHELVHVWQLQNNQSWNHGPSFFQWKKKFSKNGFKLGYSSD